MGRKTTTTALGNGAKLQVSFHYIRLNLGNNRSLTAGRGGETANGDIPKAVFASFVKLVSSTHSTSQADFANTLTSWFLNELPGLWPEWSKVPPVPTVGMKIRKDFGPGRGKYAGVHEGVITKVADRKNGRHTVVFPTATFGMTSGEIATCTVVA
jgi:hypothetical protein